MIDRKTARKAGASWVRYVRGEVLSDDDLTILMRSLDVIREFALAANLTILISWSNSYYEAMVNYMRMRNLKVSDE